MTYGRGGPLYLPTLGGSFAKATLSISDINDLRNVVFIRSGDVELFFWWKGGDYHDMQVGQSPMKLYFSCSLTGGREFERIYALMVDHLLAERHEVPTAHLALPEVMALERIVDPGEVFQRDMSWIRECDALIAEVSTPSHGVGYEIAYALGLGKPVLCCYQAGVQVSKILLGNDIPKLTMRSYKDDVQLLAFVDQFLKDL